jgi:hypothetical protein
MPTFQVEVLAILPLLQPVEEIPFDPTFGLPSVGELLMGGIGKIRSAVVNYKRGRAEHRARKEVCRTNPRAKAHGFDCHEYSERCI